VRFLGKAWVQCTGALDPLRCCHVFSFVQFLYTWQHLNGSSAPVHWTQAVPKIFNCNETTFNSNILRGVDNTIRYVAKYSNDNRVVFHRFIMVIS
jgi:hypothetical protein